VSRHAIRASVRFASWLGNQRSMTGARRFAIALLVPCAVPAQPPAVPAPHAATIDAMPDAPARTAVRELLDRAPARGIPVEPLLTKVREGIAKRANPERIRDAVQLLSQRLEQARGALDPALSVAELSAGAGAIQSGVSLPTLRELRHLSPAAPLTVPLGVLTEMIADGVPPRPAGLRIRELVARGASSAQLIAMGADVRADVATGIAPGTALELRSKRVISLLVAPVTPTFSSPVPPLRPGRPGPP